MNTTEAEQVQEQVTLAELTGPGSVVDGLLSGLRTKLDSIQHVRAAGEMEDGLVLGKLHQEAEWIVAYCEASEALIQDRWCELCAAWVDAYVDVIRLNDPDALPQDVHLALLEEAKRQIAPLAPELVVSMYRKSRGW